jgi:hypothetical protein
MLVNHKSNSRHNAFLKHTFNSAKLLNFGPRFTKSIFIMQKCLVFSCKNKTFILTLP